MTGGVDGRFSPCGCDDVYREADKFGSKRRQSVELSIGVALFHFKIPALDISEITHSQKKLTAQALHG